MKLLRSVAIPFAVFALAATAHAADADAAIDGGAIYAQRCAACHDGSTDVRIPKKAEIATHTPESIMSVMFSGAMVIQASGLTQEQGRALAKFITGKEVSGTGLVAPVNQCAFSPPMSIGAADWTGWSTDTDNSRYQTKPGLAAADVPKLKLKWAFGYPSAKVAYSQPTVVGGRLFVGSSSGNVYSLDAATGCTHWTFNAGPGVRTAVVIAKAKSGKGYVAYFGDQGANVHAVDAETGKELWKVKMDDHPAARITGTPAFYNGRLYVPISSIEEGSAAQGKYECCKFRGGLAALDAETGKQIWLSRTISAEAKPYKKSRLDVQMWGPAGAAVWSSPTLDPKRKLVYVATGDSYTDVDVETDDAIIAFNMDTGKLAWSKQVLEKDNFIVGCPNGPNCPDSKGPDYDFGSSSILRTIGRGKQVLVAGQKSGIVWGLDPDKKGEVLWQIKVGAGSALGGVEWGHAADEKNAYAAISDRTVRQGGTPGLYAIDLATGKKVWGTPSPVVKCEIPAGCIPGQSAAVTVIPGVIFSGALNGHFRAYAAASGEIIWDYDTEHDYDTVNKVPARGGSIDAGGPAVVNGMVFTNSGYASFGGAAGNVLLAFSVDGK